MRSISPRAKPAAFTEWRAASKNDVNYGYDLIPGELRGEIKDAPLVDRMVSNAGLRVRIVVNVHPERGLSAERTVRKYAEDFLRTSWPFQPKPELYYSPGSLKDRGSGLASVHAKLIVVDVKRVYVGSANFTTAAFERNIEAGIRLRSPEMGQRLTEYFDQMIASGYLRALDAVRSEEPRA